MAPLDVVHELQQEVEDEGEGNLHDQNVLIVMGLNDVVDWKCHELSFLI